MRTVVVLPTYNEAENIGSMLDLVLDSPVVADVLVVDDNSPDGTAGIVRSHRQYVGGRVRLLSRAGKEGLGAAYRAGFRAALDHGYDVVVQMDADGSHPVAALPSLVYALAAGADLALGSRYVPGGAVVDWPLRRRLLSRGGNVFARRALGIAVRDLTGGYKAWSAAALRGVDLDAADASGYAFQIQTTVSALRRGARVVEVPITFADRRFGRSKMTPAIAREAVGAVLALRRRADQPAQLHVPVGPAELSA